MLPWSFSEEAAVQKYMPQLQHNMRVVAARSAVLSVITGGGSPSSVAPIQRKMGCRMRRWTSEITCRYWLRTSADLGPPPRQAKR
jgi:hypothetical protein